MRKVNQVLAVLVALLLAAPVLAGQSFKDVDGIAFELSKPAQRIVPLAPHITEMLLSMGAGAQIVAAADDHEARGGNAITRSGFPVISDSAAISYEHVKAVKPDLILAWGEGTPRAWIAQLRKQGLPVFVIGTPALDDLVVQVSLLGQLTGHVEEAEKQANDLRASLAKLSALDRGGKRLNYFLQIWRQPLYSLRSEHPLSQALARCGADNIVPSSATAAPLINPEFVVKANPDVILLPAEDFEASRQWWQRFPRLKAVKGKRWLALKDTRLTRPGPGMITAVLPLCEQLQEWRSETGVIQP